MSLKVCFAATTMILSACASMPKADPVPRLAEAIPASHYSGTWLEIGRRPMWLTDGCVAGYTTYGPGQKSGEIAVVDGCHDKTPNGKLKTIKARGVLLDASTQNANLEVHYPFFITWTYRVLYEAPDHSWFISADPKMKNLWIYARTVPSSSDLAAMVDKAKLLGYDVSKLEFPAQ